MKDFLVDVPVRVNVWIRPECQRTQFDIIKQARPSILFLVSDGGRNEEEWQAIRQNRQMFDDEIDWNCTVYKLYEEKNNGLYSMGKKARELIWSKVDRCIFLEDDYIVSVSFFKYCAELLEKYKDDTRVGTICGMNYEGESQYVTSDYFFAKHGSVWGTATWKRVHELRNDAFDYVNDEYIFNLLKKKTRKNKIFKNQIIGYANNEIFERHPAGGEFFNHFNALAHNMLYVIPKYNMISNVGATKNGAHASELKMLPKATRKLFNLKTYEYSFPLKHPKYMVADEDYEKMIDDTLAFNKPIVKFFRRIEVLFLTLKYKGVKEIFNKIKKRKNRKKEIET